MCRLGRIDGGTAIEKRDDKKAGSIPPGGALWFGCVDGRGLEEMDLHGAESRLDILWSC